MPSASKFVQQMLSKPGPHTYIWFVECLRSPSESYSSSSWAFLAHTLGHLRLSWVMGCYGLLVWEPGVAFNLKFGNVAWEQSSQITCLSTWTLTVDSDVNVVRHCIQAVLKVASSSNQYWSVSCALNIMNKDQSKVCTSLTSCESLWLMRSQRSEQLYMATLDIHCRIHTSLLPVRLVHVYLFRFVLCV